MDSSPNRRATIKDVAKLAGVGTMTVSRVARETGYVSAETKAKVLAAMQQLGYVQNELASSLRSRRTSTIALLVSDITNPFFTTVARGAEDAASNSGDLVLFCNTDEDEQEELRYLRLLVQRRVDGVLLVPAGDGLAAVSFAARHHLPMVVLDRQVTGPVDQVRCDSTHGGELLGEHVRAQGHRKVVILAGPRELSTTWHRLEGFKRGLGDAETHVLHGAFSRESGAELAIAALEHAPTAIFAMNNFMSIGAVQALTARGVRIPEDMSIVGFDDLPDSMVMFPFLTVASQPAYEMGEEGVRILAMRREDPQLPPSEVILPTRLVVRSSCAHPPTLPRTR